jgi:hypothetical protein
VTPKAIPYEDQLTSSAKMKEIPLSEYLKEMRTYSLTLQQWLQEQYHQTKTHNNSSSGGDDEFYSLSRFGGIGKSNDGNREEYPHPSPRYIFEVIVIISSLLPFFRPPRAPVQLRFSLSLSPILSDSLHHHSQILSPHDLVSSLLLSPFPERTNTHSRSSSISDPSSVSLLFDEIIQSTFDSFHSSPATNTASFHSKKPYSVTRQFYLGPPLSGAPFHAHGPAFNALLSVSLLFLAFPCFLIFHRSSGRKLWFLLPPGSDLYSNIPPMTWGKRMETPLPGSPSLAFPLRLLTLPLLLPKSGKSSFPILSQENLRTQSSINFLIHHSFVNTLSPLGISSSSHHSTLIRSSTLSFSEAPSHATILRF